MGHTGALPVTDSSERASRSTDGGHRCEAAFVVEMYPTLALSCDLVAH